jgi:hypothetical protein
VVRTADRRFKAIKLTRKTAIACMCTECLGWEAHPSECTSVTCPLYPFRMNTRLTQHGNIDTHPNDVSQA